MVFPKGTKPDCRSTNKACLRTTACKIDLTPGECALFCFSVILGYHHLKWLEDGEKRFIPPLELIVIAMPGVKSRVLLSRL